MQQLLLIDQEVNFLQNIFFFYQIPFRSRFRFWANCRELAVTALNKDLSKEHVFIAKDLSDKL